MSDTMSEGLLVKWLKRAGDSIASGDILAEVETDKAVMELENYEDGILLHVAVKEGERVAVNALIAVVGEKGEDISALLSEATSATPERAEEATEKEMATSVQPAAPSAEAAAAHKQELPPARPAVPRDSSAEANERVKVSPLARRMAAENGISLHGLTGSGDGGRIIKRDVLAAEHAAPAERGLASEVPLAKEGERVELSQMRLTIANRLSQSKFSAPHFYLRMEVEVSALVTARKQLNERSEVRISFNDMILKATAQALLQHPAINSSWQDDHIYAYSHAHIGVAVAVPDGLLVPVVRHADQKSLTQIASEVSTLATQARERKLQPQQWEGSSFSISNLGMYGIDDFTAIINSPNAAILAVGAILDRPVVDKEGIRAGKSMCLTLSCDHRVIDGASGAAFLQTLKGYLEDPLTMLL